jgi:hemolysin activation/secretion protein
MRFRQTILIAASGFFSTVLFGQMHTTSQASSGFEVRSYRLVGETILPVEQISGVLTNYTGMMELSRIQSGLVALQQLYRQSGCSNVEVTMPHQWLTNGIVQVEVRQARTTEQTSPGFDVRSYRFVGETILPVEQINGVLTNYIGVINLPRIQEGLVALQQLYHQSGYTNVEVALPRQRPTNGVVLLDVVSSRPRESIRPVVEVTDAPAKPAPTLAVKTYRVEGNTVLAPRDFGVLSNYTGTNVTFAQLREGLGKVQLRYRELGYSTIGVTLPQQKITNSVVRVKIVEGRLANINVSGNQYFSSNNVRRALPGLTTNILLNTKWFQPELDLANANRDRQIYPVVSPGPEPGTSDLTLKVKDRLPLHGRLEINDKSTPGTALLRTDLALQYGNLWQREHAIGIDYNFSPQEYKSDDDAHGFPPDYPQVAIFSGFYRIPLGSGDNLREQSEQQPTTFGYDEVSHKFNLPSVTGRPALTIYGSHSSSDTRVQYGPLTTIFTNTLADISSRFAQHTPTVNDNIGFKLNVPLSEFWSVKSVLSFGLDYKYYNANTYSTNLTYFDLYALDAYGNRVLVTNQTVRLSANNSQSLYYLPLSLGWAAFRPDPVGSFQMVFNTSLFLEKLASDRSDFQQVALNSNAGGNYATLNAGLIRQQKLPGDWSFVANANGQWATRPLIGNEQFGLGGTSGVRGYHEGEVYGDIGWRTLCDLRTPSINVGYFPTAKGEVPALLRGSVFMDYGRVYFLDRPGQGAVSEWGTGFGLYLTAGEHFDARLTVGWALLGSSSDSGSSANNYVTTTTAAGSALAYFSVGYQF